jgi:CheY-like chemotaxis protein
VDKTVLIVEDDLSIRETIKEILEFEGYDVLQAENGQIALDVLRNSSPLPHLIFLDLMMPVKDGFAFRKEQQKDPLLKDIPVVIMSADGHVFEKKARIGATDYLQKPADLDEIFEVLNKHFPIHLNPSTPTEHL